MSLKLKRISAEDQQWWRVVVNVAECAPVADYNSFVVDGSDHREAARIHCGFRQAHSPRAFLQSHGE